METAVVIVLFVIAVAVFEIKIKMAERSIKTQMAASVIEVNKFLSEDTNSILAALENQQSPSPGNPINYTRKPLKAKSMAQIRRATQRANQEIEAKELNRELNTNSE